MGAGAFLKAIHRFPAKGLDGEKLMAAQLKPEQPLKNDRRFAFAHGGSDFDPKKPAWVKKAHFLTWARQPRMAQLRATWSGDGTRLTLKHDGKLLAESADLGSAAGRAKIEAILFAFMGADARGAVRAIDGMTDNKGLWFSDVPQPYLSIQNAASLKELGDHLGADADWRRMRGNLLIEGFAPWAEMQWIGHKLKIGAATLRVDEIITRCPATQLNPDTGTRDLDTLAALRQHYNHQDCGLYATVIEGGLVQPGDSVQVL